MDAGERYRKGLLNSRRVRGPRCVGFALKEGRKKEGRKEEERRGKGFRKIKKLVLFRREAMEPARPGRKNYAKVCSRRGRGGRGKQCV